MTTVATSSRACFLTSLFLAGLVLLAGCRGVPRGWSDKGTAAASSSAPGKPSTLLLPPPVPEGVWNPVCGGDTVNCAIPGPSGGCACAVQTTTSGRPGWLSELQARASRLEEQVQQLEKELQASRDDRATAEAALQRSRQDAAQLNRDLAFWQTEFKRLERETAEQHQADLEALDELTRMLGDLAVRSQVPATRTAP